MTARKWSWIRLFFSVTAFISLIVLAFWAMYISIKILAIAVTVISFANWIWADRKMQKIHSQQLHGKQQNERNRLFLHTINHYRHDLMNDIQVLFGYLSLKKYDKLQEYVENIKRKAARESYISKLGVPALAVYLHAFRADCRNIQLQVDLEQEINLSELPLNTNDVVEIVKTIMELIKENAIPTNEDPSQLILEIMSEEDGLYLSFEYDGECAAAVLDSAVESSLQTYYHNARIEVHSEIEQKWAAIEVRLPYIPNEVDSCL